MLAHSAVLLALAAPPSTTPDPCGPHSARLREEARAAYGDGRYLTAARRFRSLATCSSDPRDIFNAVQSLVEAERFAAALELWAAAERAEVLPPELRARGRALVDIARSHTTPVRITLEVEGFAPPHAATVRLCRTAADEPVTDACDELERPVLVSRHGAALDLALERGSWLVRVAWDGRSETAERTLVVDGAPDATSFLWRSSRPHRRLAAGFLGLAAIDTAAGLGLAIGGWQHDVTRAAADHNRDGLEALPLRTAGAALGASGLGFAISGATMAWTTAPRLRRYGAAALAIGTAFGGVGAALIAHAASDLARPPAEGDGTGADRCEWSRQCAAAEQLAGGVALGLGASLIAGGIAGLVVDRPAARPRYAAGPLLTRGFAGVRLRIDF